MPLLRRGCHGTKSRRGPESVGEQVLDLHALVNRKRAGDLRRLLHGEPKPALIAEGVLQTSTNLSQGVKNWQIFFLFAVFKDWWRAQSKGRQGRALACLW